jgi:hypothetical protein
MAEFSEMKVMDLWYFALESEKMISIIPDPMIRKRVIRRLEKERSRSIAEDIFPKLAGYSGNSYFIKDQLPTIFHFDGHNPGEVDQLVRDTFALYRKTLVPAYQVLLYRYEIMDAAIKVVGIGSVGTYCLVLLLMSGERDPLFLQVKQALTSVLEPYAGKSIYSNNGQRVVNGYLLMPPFSDSFLGWTIGTGPYGLHFFI